MTPLPLETILPFVLPLLKPALATEESAPALYEMARALPPVGRGGFECRLASGASQVDLHQLIKRSYGEHHVLAGYLSSPEAGTVRPGAAWTAVRNFASWWSGTRSEDASLVSSVFLELDHVAERRPIPAPSLFFKLSGSDGIGARRALKLVDEIFDVMGLSQSTERIKQVFTTCDGMSARITHVGLMLSRSTRALRLNVFIPAIEAIPELLRAVGWSGDYEVLERELDWLSPFVEKIVCALDVDDTVYPHVGLECFINEKGGPGSRWRGFMDGLTRRGLCDPEKAAGFLSFQRLLMPSSATQPWPDPLIRHALTTDNEGFSTIACMVHHVKLTLAPGRPPAAKGYLGFGHHWLEAGGTGKKSDVTPEEGRPFPLILNG